MNRLFLASLALVSIAQSSCATFHHYQEPAGPSARLRMDIDPAFTGISAISQDFRIGKTDEFYADYTAVDPPLSRNLWFQENPHSAEKLIPAGERVFVGVKSSWAAGGTQYHSVQRYCIGALTFVPIVNRTYVAVHRTPSCELEIVDEMTGVAPPDARLFFPSGIN